MNNGLFHPLNNEVNREEDQTPFFINNALQRSARSRRKVNGISCLIPVEDILLQDRLQSSLMMNICH